MLHLVLLASLLHQRDGLIPRQGEGLDGQVGLDNLPHLLLDGLEILVAELGIPQVHVVVEAVVGGGAVGKVRLRVQMLDGLGQDVGAGVAHDRQLLLRSADVHSAVAVDNLHTASLLILINFL